MQFFHPLAALCAAWSVVFGLGAVPPAAADDVNFKAELEAYAQTYEPRLPGLAFVDGNLPDCGRVWHADDDRLHAPATGPMVMDHGEVRDDVVILFHGLSDSPWFLCAIARAFFDAGANVVMPLSSGHGLATPLPGAYAPDLAERWKEDALNTFAFASTRGRRISAGGLSTGGLLAVWLWEETRALNGGIFLFSAAFDFHPMLRIAAGCVGTVAERQNNVLRRWCHSALSAGVKWAERDVIWHGRNPYRQYFSLYGAMELGVLRRTVLGLLGDRPFDPPLFIAHSIDDTTAPIRGVQYLAAAHTGPLEVAWFPIDDVGEAQCPTLGRDCDTPLEPQTACPVPHASVPLLTPVYQDAVAGGPICEPANPTFPQMIQAMLDFFKNLP